VKSYHTAIDPGKLFWVVLFFSDKLSIYNTWLLCFFFHFLKTDFRGYTIIPLSPSWLFCTGDKRPSYQSISQAAEHKRRLWSSTGYCSSNVFVWLLSVLCNHELDLWRDIVCLYKSDPTISLQRIFYHKNLWCTWSNPVPIFRKAVRL